MLKGKMCEKAAEYWFMHPWMKKRYACREHMWGLLEAVRGYGVEIPCGKLEAGEKERCWRIIHGGQEHEKMVEGCMARDIRSDDLDSDNHCSQHSNSESDKRIISAMERRREKKGRRDRETKKRRRTWRRRRN